MKRILLILNLVIIISLNAQTYSLFDDTYLHEIKITFAEPDFWDTLTANYENNPIGSVPYLISDVEIDGQILNDVGVRQKGFASNFFVMGTKKPLKLDFDEFAVGQEFSGVSRVNLGNGVGDPAIIKDKLVYDIMRFHGVPAPRVAHTKLYINNTFWGVYSIVEQVNKDFLKRNFASNKGNLWKSIDNTELNYVGTSSSDYPELALKTNTTANDWSKLIHFIDVINNTPQANFKDSIESIFNVDSYLRILAIDVLSENWDSYLDHGRNFYIYHEPKSDKINWLPWDYNFSFERDAFFPFGGLDLIQNDMAKHLVYKIMQVPEFKTKYLDYMCEILEVNFIEDRLEDIIDDHYTQVSPGWNAASNNIFDQTDVFNSLFGTWDGEFGQQFVGISDYLLERTTELNNQITTEGHTCVNIPNVIESGVVVINELMPNNDSTAIFNDQNGEYDDWIELYNNSSNEIDLTNYFLSDNSEFLKKWRIPNGTTIGANQYVILWADKDLQQTGNHSNFKLDKGGEELYLTYLDDSKIDTVVFGAQGSTLSYSRIPNGTGPFEQAKITYSTENQSVVTIKDVEEIEISVYPNPASHYIKVELDENFKNSSEIDILDAAGKRVFYSLVDETNNGIYTIDILDWNTGIYFVKVKSENAFATEVILVK